jgi:streptogramin lyase
LDIGRDRGLDVTLDDPAVSARHARLTPAEDGATLEDLGSTNGTFVNGSRIAGPTVVHDGDTIRVGDTELGLQADKPVAATVVQPRPPELASTQATSTTVTDVPPEQAPAPAPAAAAAASTGERRRRPGRRWLAAVVGLAALAAAAGAAAYLATRDDPEPSSASSSTSGSNADDGITEFTRGFKGHPAALTVGPDGRLWMTEPFDDKLAVFDPATSKATEFDLPRGTQPHDLAFGPDGKIWFTSWAHQVGSFEPGTRRVTLLRRGVTPGSFPHLIIAGPDGNIYFSEQFARFDRAIPGGNGRLGMVDLETQKITEFPGSLPAGNHIHGIAAGPDGHVWVGLRGADQLARFNVTTKRFDRFASFSAFSGPNALAFGPDDNIYVALQDGLKIGRYNPRTGEVREFPAVAGAGKGLAAGSIVAGRDGRSIWLTVPAETPLDPGPAPKERIVRFDVRTERVTEFRCIAALSDPIDIEVGRDGNVWFTELNPGEKALRDTSPPPESSGSASGQSSSRLLGKQPGRLARLVLARARSFAGTSSCPGGAR